MGRERAESLYGNQKEGTYKVVFEADTFVEVRFPDSQRRRLQRVVYRPERGAGGIAHARRAVAGNAICLAEWSCKCQDRGNRAGQVGLRTQECIPTPAHASL